jgi:hypothetical protein
MTVIILDITAELEGWDGVGHYKGILVSSFNCVAYKVIFLYICYSLGAC